MSPIKKYHPMAIGTYVILYTCIIISLIRIEKLCINIVHNIIHKKILHYFVFFVYTDYWTRVIWLVFVVTENSYRGHYHHDRIVYVPSSKPNMFGLAHHQYGAPPPPPPLPPPQPSTVVGTAVQGATTHSTWQSATGRPQVGSSHHVSVAAAAGSPANNNGGGIATAGHPNVVPMSSSPSSVTPPFYQNAAAAAAAAAIMWPNPTATAFQAHHYGMTIIVYNK